MCWEGARYEDKTDGYVPPFLQLGGKAAGLLYSIVLMVCEVLLSLC